VILLHHGPILQPLRAIERLTASQFAASLSTPCSQQYRRAAAPPSERTTEIALQLCSIPQKSQVS
jgi:hypothetical protein